MFFDANITHFTVYIQGLSADQTNSSGEAPPQSAVDRLQVLSFQAIEGISSPYAAQVELINEHIRFDITQLLSKPIFLAFTPEGKTGPGIHGIIQQVRRGAVDSHHARFTIVITPRFTNLMRRTNQRKFVGKTTPEIIKVILEEHGITEGADNGFEYKLKDPSIYPARDFCVQYDESDYHFVSRLCEEEGIAYSFQHTATAHKMIFTDAMPFFPSIKDAVQFMNDSGMHTDTQVIKYFDVSLASKTTTSTWRDYNFTNMKIPEGTSNGLQSEKGNKATEPNLEYYDYPSSGIDKARNEQLAKVQIERLRTDHLQAEAYSDVSTLHSGYYITLKDHPPIQTMNADDPWLITQIIHKGYQPQVLTYLTDTDSAKSTTTNNNTQTNLLSNYLDPNSNTKLDFPVQDQAQGYFNVFNAIPREVPYRPNRKHPKAKVLGSQTAVVTGAAGEEIYCDEYGRVKVQFHWDRDGTMDEHSSHWIRVASNWAGDGYGTVIIPRINMEVKIDFLEGDPDQPIITGAIHNGINKVPYDLPANKTRSVFKTSSSKGGIGSNELRIEDKAGQEQIFVQSQKDFDQLTKNNHTIQINNNSHLQVQNEHSETIKKNRYTKNESEEHHLTQLDRKTQILANDYKTVGISEHETIGTIKTTQAGMEIHLKSGLQTVIDGGLSLTLKAGGQHIVLNPAGIWMTMPVWTGGVPMDGTPAAPVPPLGMSGSVAATSAPPVSPVQLATLKKNAPFCLECMLASMGICQPDFTNKTTPDGILDTSKLTNLTQATTSSPLTNMGGIANGGIAGANLPMGATPTLLPNNESLTGLTNKITQTGQLLKDPTATLAEQATKQLTDTASQALTQNEQLSSLTQTGQQTVELAKQAKHTTEQLSKVSQVPKTNPTDFITGINGNLDKGGKV